MAIVWYTKASGKITSILAHPYNYASCYDGDCKLKLIRVVELFINCVANIVHVHVNQCMYSDWLDPDRINPGRYREKRFIIHFWDFGQ